LDGTFLKQWQRELAYGLASEFALEIEILDFDAPVHVLRERIFNRKGDPSDATLEVLEQQIAAREALTDKERRLIRQENT
jgi:predicted kinase